MGESTEEDKLERYSKRSRNIVYSTQIFNNKDKKPKIILRELEELGENKVWTLILKYEIDGIPQEVIMGLLNDTQNKKEKVMEIIKLMTGQLEENVDDNLDYESYEELARYVRNQRIPFELTPEGLKILYSKDKNNISIPRTYYEDVNGKIKKLFFKEDLDKMKEDMSYEVKKQIEDREKEDKWTRAKNKFLNNADKQIGERFLKGEQIYKILSKSDILEDDSEDIIKQKKKEQRDIAIEELYQSYNVKLDKDGKNLTMPQKKKLLLNKFLGIKENGIIHDIMQALEKNERDIYSELNKSQGKDESEELDKIKEIQNYEQFFKLVSDGRDLNARIYALKIQKINFDEMKEKMQQFGINDKEIYEYIDMKKKVIDELGTENTKGKEESDYKSIEDFNKFLLNSSTREYTEKSEELIVSEIYKLAREKLLEDNWREIYEYNSVARRYDRPLCPMPERNVRNINFKSR